MPRYKEGTEKKICILKNKARKFIEAGNIEYSMQLTSCIGQIEYALNQQFIDQDIEKLIQGFVTCLDYTIDTYTVDTDHRESKSIAFYDGFGLDLRGLAYIYLKGLISEGYRIKYITEDKHWKRLENIAELLRENNSEIYLLQQTGMKERALAIYEQIYDSDVSKAILYTSPVDVSAIVAFNKLENMVERFRINLTDHAFWIGVKCTDYCIEFRNYGASISCIYRGLEKERLLIQPFYPAVISEQKFGGFPSVREDNDFWIFSGGALYKTGSRDNLYYDTVRKMLDSDERVKFWYAGYGESHEMDRLLKDYQGRAFYTSERKDLFQLMCRCDLYFSTYPIAGGLMTQYACKAGIIPLTLKSGNHEDELIFDQEEKNIDFLDQDKLLLEFKKILFDRNYKKEKEKLLNDSVIQEERFNTNLHAILEEHVSGYKTSICQIDVKKLQNIFSINNGKKTIENAVATLSNRNLIRVIPFFYTSCLLARLGKWGGIKSKEELTIYVVIYEPDWNKLKKTLLSVLYQKHINYEIVISDDGSEYDCFDNIKELFNKYGFENYKLVKFEQNQGTVKNVANAVFNGSGIYARGLSPGDMLSSPTQLSSWFNWFECNNHFVGFGDCIYFSNEDDYKEHLIKNSPICKWLYKQNNQIAKARIDYLVLNDYIGGASFMFNRDIFLFYIQNIVDKVKYAEDNVFRIMMFDGIIPVYYEEHVTFYEYGSGISTSCNGKWKKLLQKDKQEANRVIMGREAWDYLSYRYKIWLNIENRSLKENIVTRGIKYFLFPSSLFIKLKGNLQPVYTMNSLDSEKSYYDFVSNL